MRETKADYVTVEEFARMLRRFGVNTGRRRLMKQLQLDGFLIVRGDDRNLPTRAALELGLMEIRESCIRTPEGLQSMKAAVITDKGQVYFMSRYLEAEEGGIADDL